MLKEKAGNGNNCEKTGLQRNNKTNNYKTVEDFQLTSFFLPS